MQSNLSIYLGGLKRLILSKNPIYLLPFVLVFFSQFRIDAQTVNAGLDTLVCSGDTIKLGGKPVATGSPVSFSWTSSASSNVFSTDSTPDVSSNSTISYYLAQIVIS